MLRSVTRLLLLGKVTVASCFCLVVSLQGRELGRPGSAVDAKGVRHSAREYGGKVPPWASDIDYTIGPEYSPRDRRLYNQGTGLFRLSLDLKTGAVVKITVVQSTGTSTLDRAVLVALRQWRWKPGRWKEVDIPVTFHMGSGPPKIPPGAMRLRNP